MAYLHVITATANGGLVWVDVSTPVHQQGQPGITRVLYVPVKADDAREAARQLLEAAETAEAQPRRETHQA